MNTGLGAIEAFNAGRQRAIGDQTQRRAEAARQAETDYFTAKHTPGISNATLDRGTEMGLPMGGGAQGVAPRPANLAAPSAPNQNEALIRLAQADPSRAFALEDREKTARSKELDDMHKLNAASGRLLAGVSDQQSYESAMGRMKKMFARFGESMDDYDVPGTYDPSYVQSLRMSALDIDKQLAAERGAKRLEWDIEDDQADNERADRNTDSVITDRSARRDITVRGQNLSDARGRRGQDLSDSRGRRGQDIASSDRRRGQDVSDKRLRETVGNRGARRANAGSGAPAPAGQAAGSQKFTRTATDPSTGKKVGWNGSRWVPAN